MKDNKYIISRSVATKDGRYIRHDEVVVTEKDLMRAVALLTAEPWFSKMVIRKKED